MPNLRERTSDLRLEYYHKDNEADCGKVREEPFQTFELEPEGDERNQEQNRQPTHDLSRSGASDQHQHLVNDETDHSDIDKVEKRETQEFVVK
jgi:hypothetical protein